MTATWLERHTAAVERERQLAAVLDSLRPSCTKLECHRRTIEYVERPGELYGDPVRPGARIWPALLICRAVRLCSIEDADPECATIAIRLPCGERYTIQPTAPRPETGSDPD